MESEATRQRPIWLDLPLRGAAQLYGLGAYLHRSAYHRGLLKRRELPCAVLSVGNLSLGGSAKTPLVVTVASQLKSEGYRVAVASRGYGRRADRPVEVVSDGTHVRADARRAGDEPWLLAGKLPGVPILVGRDRGTVGLRAVAMFGTEVLILDDGFQHHRLARDVELVAVHAATGFGGGRVFPAGPLRERVTVLGRADAFVVVDGELSPEDTSLLTEHARGMPIFPATRSPSARIRLADRRALPLDDLAGKELGLISGIARPEAFRRTVESLGARVVATRFFSDHHVYSPRDLESLEKEAPLWMTTEKDAMKLRPEWAPRVPVDVLAIELRLGDSHAFAAFLKQRVGEAIERKRARRGTTARGGSPGATP